MIALDSPLAPHLHDAVLVALSVDWRKGVAKAAFRLVTPSAEVRKAELIASGLRRLQVPREQPWGESVCVNRLEIRDARRIVIEMQSGDQIELEAEHFGFRDPRTFASERPKS